MGTIPSKNVEDLTSQSAFENHSNPDNGSGSSNIRGFELYGAASSHVKGNDGNSTSNSCYTGPTEAIQNGPRNTLTSKSEMDPSRFFYDNFPCVLPASQTPRCPQSERTVIFPGEYLPQSSTRSSLPTSSVSSQKDVIADQQVFNLKEFTTNRQDTCNPRGQTTSLHTLDRAPRINKRKISSLPTDLQSTTCFSAAHTPQEATHKSKRSLTSAAPKPVEATHNSMSSLSVDMPLAEKKAGRAFLKKKGGSCGKKLVNHEYRDFSNARCRDTYRKRPGRGHAIQFPERLHSMLEETSSDASLASIVSWKAHGRAFFVYDLEKFVKFIIPVHFKQSKWSSFQRQLNIYGFKRLTQGRDSGCYYHECFLRGIPDLCSNLQRFNIKGNGTKATSNPNDEPDFYLMPTMDRPISNVIPGPIPDPVPGPITDAVPGPITDAVPGPIPNTVSDPISNTVPGPISDPIPSSIPDPGLDPVSSNTISSESCLIESTSMVTNEAISKKLVAEQVVPNQVDADPKNLPVLESLKGSPSEHSKLNSDFPNKTNLLSSEDTESKKRHHSESTSRPCSKVMKFNSESLKLYEMSKLRPQQSTDSLLSFANIATDPLIEQCFMESMGHMFTNKQPDKVSTFLLSRNKSEQQVENSECAKSKKQEESFLKSNSLSPPTSLINAHTQGTLKNTQCIRKNQEKLIGRRIPSVSSGDRIASSTTSNDARPRKVFSFPSHNTLLGYVAQDENVLRRQCSFPSRCKFKTNSIESLEMFLSQENLDLSAGFFKSSDDNMNEVIDLSHYVPKSET